MLGAHTSGATFEDAQAVATRNTVEAPGITTGALQHKVRIYADKP